MFKFKIFFLLFFNYILKTRLGCFGSMSQPEVVLDVLKPCVLDLSKVLDKNVDKVETPQWIYEYIRTIYSEWIDPCPIHWDGVINGLEVDWGPIDSNCYVNPPFSKTKLWVEKCLEQYQSGRHVLLLLKCDQTLFNRDWWHDIIMKHFTIFIFRRVYPFKGFKKPPRFSIILCRFGGRGLMVTLENKQKGFYKKANFGKHVFQ